ncbi:TVP38/TMEM64 family protein [Veillonella parvula]|uniref:TVP38/TMEM64 family protein n=1 Tax=Veillonella parvula TaxID=29466 RepID=UPI000E6A03A7|nr:TVP38/TMEM64 family protein [Veillonella parvula]RIW09770.1 TVP38/TMEM64 family protein [Veillonella parvula]
MSKRNLKPSGEGWVQLIAGIGFIVLLIIINIVDPTFYPTMWHLATSGSMEEVAEYIQSFGPMAMLVSMVLDIFVNAVGFLPSIFISTANGLVFGMWSGIIISWLAETIGVVISFYIMRYFLRDTADKLIAKSTVLMKVDDFSGKNGFVVMLFARSLPYFPSGVITALGAISKIKPRDYILANLIGKFPSTALEVAIGTDIVNFQENMGRLGIIVLVAGVVYFILWKVYKNYINKKNAEQEHDPNA